MSRTGSSKPRVETAHTADLDAATLREVRELLDEVFQADMTEHSWAHLLGGMHALVWEAEELVAHWARGT
jgi:aminoglycoside 2'-N-acetyltransferase I